MQNPKPKKDKCVGCGIETQYDEFDHIDFRNFYIEGAGQLCPDCFDKLYGTAIMDGWQKNEALSGDMLEMLHYN